MFRNARPLSLALNVAHALAAGDLKARMEVNSRDETGQLLTAMQAIVAKLLQIIGEVRGSADALSSASEEVSATAEEMSGQAMQLQQVMSFFKVKS